MSESLDTLLDVYLTAEPDAALHERIIAAAPRQRALGRAWRWLAGAGLGAGLAAACAAGVAAGMSFAPDGVTRLIGDPAVASDGGGADPLGDAGDG